MARPHFPKSLGLVMDGGQLTVGGSVSFIFTIVNEQVEVLLLRSFHLFPHICGDLSREKSAAGQTADECHRSDSTVVRRGGCRISSDRSANTRVVIGHNIGRASDRRQGRVGHRHGERTGGRVAAKIPVVRQVLVVVPTGKLNHWPDRRLKPSN